MKSPEKQIPQDLNWADYFDALNNERFSWPAIERRRSRNPGHVPERRAQQGTSSAGDKERLTRPA